MSTNPVGHLSTLAGSFGDLPEYGAGRTRMLLKSGKTQSSPILLEAKEWPAQSINTSKFKISELQENKKSHLEIQLRREGRDRKRRYSINLIRRPGNKPYCTWY